MRIRLAFLALVLLLALVPAGGCTGTSGSTPASPGVDSAHTFIEWSDIHYTSTKPYFVPAAWEAAAAGGVAADPEFVVLGGDILDDNIDGDQQLYGQFMDTFLPQLSSVLDQVGRPVVLTLGNEDFYLDYDTSPDVMAFSLQRFRQWLGSRFYLDDLGNGVYPERLLGMRWISLNSVIFSPKNGYDGRPGQAREALDWLQRQLQEDPAGPVVLLTHIPPTMDLYNQTLPWRCEDLQRFVEVLATHPGPIVILAGHYHRNEVHALRVPGHEAVPVFSAGATAAKYGNLPNWRTCRWTVEEGRLVEAAYHLQYPGLPSLDTSWSWSQPLRSRSWDSLVTALGTDPDFYRRYTLDFYAHNPKARACLETPEIRQAVVDEVWSPPVPCPEEPGTPCPD